MICRFLILMFSFFVLAQENTETPTPIEPPVITFTHDGVAGLRGATDQFPQEIVALVNVERELEGLPPLKGNTLLDTSSVVHAENMAVRNFFAHCDLDTLTRAWDRMEDAGYTWHNAGENIAAGQTSPAEVMLSWMNSPGHRANILSTDYREIGVGYYEQPSDSGGIRQDSNSDCNTDDIIGFGLFRYWVQNFGRNFNVYPLIINREALETDDAMVDLYIYGQGDASEMRIRNQGGDWSDWMTFATNVVWDLGLVAGLRTVEVELNVSGEILVASDAITLNVACFTTNDVRTAAEDWPTTETVLDLVTRQLNLCPE